MTLHPNIDSVKFDDSMNPVKVSFKVRKNGKLIKWDTPEAMKASREIMVYDENRVSLSYENLSSSIKFVGAGMDRSKRNYEMVGFIDRNYSGKKKLILSFYFKGHKENSAKVTLSIPETNLKILNSMDSLVTQQKKTAYHLSRMGSLWFTIGGMVIIAIFAILFNYRKTSLLMRQTSEHYKKDLSRMLSSIENRNETELIEAIEEIQKQNEKIKKQNGAIKTKTKDLRRKSEYIQELNEAIKEKTNEVIKNHNQIEVKLNELYQYNNPEVSTKTNEIKNILKEKKELNRIIISTIEEQYRKIIDINTFFPKLSQKIIKLNDSLSYFDTHQLNLTGLFDSIKNNSLTLSEIHYEFKDLNKKFNESFPKKMEFEEFQKFMNNGLVITTADKLKN